MTLSPNRMEKVKRFAEVLDRCTPVMDIVVALDLSLKAIEPRVAVVDTGKVRGERNYWTVTVNGVPVYGNARRQAVQDVADKLRDGLDLGPWDDKR